MARNKRNRLLGGTAMAAVLAVNAVSSAAATYGADPAYGIESVEYIDGDFYVSNELAEDEAQIRDGGSIYDEGGSILQDAWTADDAEASEVPEMDLGLTEANGAWEVPAGEIQILDVAPVEGGEGSTAITGEDPDVFDVSGQMQTDWESEAASVALTGDWAEDTAAVAQAQLGYTPYGYGEASTDFHWDILLAKFCLDYAGVSVSALPRPEEEQDWKKLLAEKGLYKQEKENISVGALAFMDTDKDGGADHIGIVTELEEGRVTAVCGNMEGAVEEYGVSVKDTALLGFCPIPENPAMPPKASGTEPDISMQEEGTEETETEIETGAEAEIEAETETESETEEGTEIETGSKTEEETETAIESETEEETETETGSKTEEGTEIETGSETEEGTETETESETEAAETETESETETEPDWEKGLEGVALTGNWPKDLVAVAETQLGYAESDSDFITDEEGNKSGYTRYGAWYGNAYAPWNVLFTEFCLHYAEIPEKAVPRPEDADAQSWVSLLTEYDMYRLAHGGNGETDVIIADDDGAALPGVDAESLPGVDAESLPGVDAESLPGADAEILPDVDAKEAETEESREERSLSAGDLAFFDTDGDGYADRTGIVALVSDGAFDTILGDVEGVVGIRSTSPEDVSFVGYCPIPDEGMVRPLAAPVQRVAKNEGWYEVHNETDFADALAEIQDEGKIKLMEDFSILEKSLEVKKGQNVTLDLNGKTLKNECNDSLFSISGGALTVEDDSTDDTVPTVDISVPKGQEVPGNVYGNTATYGNGTLTYYVTQPKVTDPDTGATTETLYKYDVAVPSKPNSPADISKMESSGKIDGNYVAGKSIFWLNGDDKGTLAIKGGQICNSAKVAVYANAAGSEIEIQGGYIYNNKVENNGMEKGGGAIYAKSSAEIKVSGGYIFNNMAIGNSINGNGGAICAAGGSTITISGGCIFDNTAAGGYGGAIYTNGTVTINNGYIYGNRADVAEGDGGGGAIYVYDKGVFTLNNGYIFDNEAAGRYGGAVMAEDNAQVNLNGGVLAGNRSVLGVGEKKDAGGGAVAVRGSVWVSIGGNCIISGNQSDKNGGGFYCKGNTSIRMNGGYVTNNRAEMGNCTEADVHGHNDGGGGFRLENASCLMLSGGSVTGNTARSGGGICINGDDTSTTNLIMDGGFVCSNRVTVDCHLPEHMKEGGGISIMMKGDTAYLNSGYINNNSIENSYDWGGGGVFCAEHAYLYIPKVMVTGNHAGGFGGGLAGCPTGHVYVLGGAAAVFDNMADGTQMAGTTSTKHADQNALRDEIFMLSGYRDFFSALGSQVQNSMLGGGTENWSGSRDGQKVEADYFDSNNWLNAYFRMGLTAHPTDADKEKAYQEAVKDTKALYLSGNRSYTHGGAVMCNGYMVVGEWQEEERITVGSNLEVSAKKGFYSLERIGITFMEGPEGSAKKEEEGSAKLFDRDLDTKWCNTNLDQAKGAILFSAGEPVKALQYSFTTADDHESNLGRVPSKWTLSASNSPEGPWIEIDRHEGNQGLISAKNYQEAIFDISSPGTYQYYKLQFDEPGEEGVQFSGFDLYGYGEKQSLPMGAGQFDFEIWQFPASYASAGRLEWQEGPEGAAQGGSEGSEKLFDEDPGTKWCNTDPQKAGGDIIFKTTASVKALQYSFTTANDHTQNPDRVPGEWTLYGSNDGTEGSWEEIDRHKGNESLLNAGNQEEVKFVISNPDTYQYYKIKFGPGSKGVQFSEFKLYKTGDYHGEACTLVSTGHNDQAGNITFNRQLSFCGPGEYTFGVIEKKMNGEAITGDRHWYKVSITVGTHEETANLSETKILTKDMYYIKTIRVNQYRNSAGHEGDVAEEGLSQIWSRTWDIDYSEGYINYAYHLFLGNNEYDTAESGWIWKKAPAGTHDKQAGDFREEKPDDEKGAAFTNVRKRETVNVAVKKIWEGYTDQDGHNSYIVTAMLQKKSKAEGSEWVPAGEKELKRDQLGEWKYTWHDLDADYIYSVKEIKVETVVYGGDGTGEKTEVPVGNFTTQYSSDGVDWESTSGGAAFAPGDNDGSGTLLIKNTKKAQGITMPGTGSKYPFIFYGLGFLLLLLSAAWMFLISKKGNRPIEAGKGGGRSDNW